MQALTKESFYKAIEKCQTTDRYKVLIVTRYLADQNLIQQEWLQPTGILFNMSCNGIKLYFPNGSAIRGVSLSSNYHGQKANLILCEDWMQHDYDISCVLQSFETLNTDFVISEE